MSTTRCPCSPDPARHRSPRRDSDDNNNYEIMIIIILQAGASCFSLLLQCVCCGRSFLSLGLAMSADLLAFMVFRLLNYIAVIFLLPFFNSCLLLSAVISPRGMRETSKKSRFWPMTVLWPVMLRIRCSSLETLADYYANPLIVAR